MWRGGHEHSTGHCRPQLVRPFPGFQSCHMGTVVCGFGDVVWPAIEGTFARNIIRECTSRKCRLLPTSGFPVALFLTGRRSGKSRIAAIIAAYEAALAGHHKKLARGERGVVAVLSRPKPKPRLSKGTSAPFLMCRCSIPRLLERIGRVLPFASGVTIQILAGDHRSVARLHVAGDGCGRGGFFWIGRRGPREE